MNSYIPIPLILMTLMSVRSVEAAAEKAIPAKDTIVLQRVPVPGTGWEMGMGIAEFPRIQQSRARRQPAPRSATSVKVR
jgi:hypothetical protein